MQNLAWSKLAIIVLVSLSALYHSLTTQSKVFASEPPLAMLKRAQRLRLQLRPEQALTVLNATVETYPKYIQAYDLRSDLNREFGNMDAALEDINKAIKLSPQTLEYIKKRAKINDMTGHLKEAIVDYDYALTKEPKALSLWRDRAIAYKRLKQYGQAAADFDTACALAKGNECFSDLLYDRAQMYLSSGNLTKALDGSNELIKQFPQMSKGHWIRAQVYDKLGKAELAAKDRSLGKVMDEDF